MELEDKEKAITSLVQETYDHCKTGEIAHFPEGSTMTLYFEDTRDNWVVDFSELLNQLGFNFSVLSINTLAGKNERLAVTLIFDINKIEEVDFW